MRLWGTHAEIAGEATAAGLPLSNSAGDLFRMMRRFFGKITIKRKIHSLQLKETLVLGDRRFLAVVEWQNKTLLLGVTQHNIALLDAKTELAVVEENQPTRQVA